MAFKNLKEIVDADENGLTRTFGFRKLPNQVTTGQFWFDLSMSPGTPIPNYYAAAPLTSTILRQSTDGGLFHGSSVSPATKYIKNLSILNTGAAGAVPAPFYILDYLMYYPFCDDGTTDEQVMIQTNSLSRYANGNGVQIMAITVAARTGGATFTVKYTNQDGVSGRTTPVIIQNSISAIGTLTGITASTPADPRSSRPFLPLQAGDTGVRSIESVTMLTTDVGLFSLVLVKPITQFAILEQTAPTEIDFVTDRSLMLPSVETDAYLNFILCPLGSVSGATIMGTLKYTWS